MKACFNRPGFGATIGPWRRRKRRHAKEFTGMPTAEQAAELDAAIAADPKEPQIGL